MRKDSENVLEQLLQYKEEIKKDSFEVNYRYFKGIPSIESAMSDILNDLIDNNCITSQSRVIDLKGNISINLTLDGIQYFDEIKLKENISQTTINVYNGGQAISAYDNAHINIGINKDSDEKKLIENKNTKQKIKSRTQEYADKWDSNMFLNDFDKRDEKAGVNVKLSEVYLDFHLSHYIWGHNETPNTDLKEFLSEYIGKRDQELSESIDEELSESIGEQLSESIDEELSKSIDEELSKSIGEQLFEYMYEKYEKYEKYEEYEEYEELSKCVDKKDENKMLLILGQPGIGKSTLITWIAINFVNDILVYRFSSDLKDINWKINNILKIILEELNISYKNLNGKVLILDGFDEINVKVDRRKILDSIYEDLTKEKYIKNVSIIITCRENYIQDFEKLRCPYIILQPWSEKQIESFCTVFHKKTKTNISRNTIENVVANKEILGVPLILYMVVALNISIEKESSIVDVYDKIFSLEGGIYDRCIDNKSFAYRHRISEIKKQIHQISREIAIWMFENNSEEASILQKEYQKICGRVMNISDQKSEDIEQDSLIGNYFKKVKHCEGIETEEICFIHRSIYEYFVAETIYNEVEETMIELSKESQKKLARNIVWYLKKGEITYTIGEYLKHKILKLYNGGRFNYEKRKRFYQWWEDSVKKMIDKGIFYYTKQNIQDYPNIINKELQCFLNLLELLRLLLNTSDKQYILIDMKREKLERYIRFCITEYSITRKDKIISVPNFSNISLEKISLRKLNLQEIILKNANLEKADLEESNLRKADLSGSNLSEANLKKANLEKSNLQKVNLNSANLKEANINQANLEEADLRETDLRGTSSIQMNLTNAKIQDSIWSKKDIEKNQLLLRDACFTYINIEDENVKRIHRTGINNYLTKPIYPPRKPFTIRIKRNKQNH